MSKDLTKLSRKELESKLAKKYGVEKYLNQRSQLLSLLGMKGETDIETGFTGPETEALSIMFEGSPVIGSRSKVEGGIVNLLQGSDEDAEDDAQDYSDVDTSQSMSGDYTDSSSDDDGSDESIEVSERGDVFGAGSAQYGKDFTQQQKDAYSKEVEQNPQLRGFLGEEIKRRIGEGDFELERNKDGLITGVYSQSNLPGMLGGLANLLGMDATGKVYTGYGKGFNVGGSDDGDDTSQMIRKVTQQKKEEKKDVPLTQAEIDYYTRGMGTATKPLKTLEDVNNYMSSLVGTTESPTGAKLSKDKKFLILPNGKIINIKTGKVQESMSGLELFAGGMI